MNMNEVLNKLNESIKAANKHEDTVKEFKMQCTDEERVIFTLNLMSKYHIIPVTKCGDIKNAEESELLRENGNKAFLSEPLKIDSCMSALKLYSESIAYAPCQSVQLALSYANRSAVLMKLHKYEECIHDIDRSLALPYPDHLKAKLYLRKIHCLQTLKYPSTEDITKEVQQWLENMSLNNINCKNLNDKLIAIRKMQKSDNSKISTDSMRCATEPPLPKIQTPNKEISCASDAVTVKYNEQYGRHVVATRKINPGEVIAIERPYSLILSSENIRTHCSNCLEVSWATIPCDYCTYSMYCSEKCKALEWEKYHDVECSVFPSMMKMQLKTFDLLSLRLVIQFVRESSSIQDIKEELKEVENCSDPRMKGFSKNGIFESDKYRSVLSLVTNTEKRPVKDLFKRSWNASFILYFLATCSNIFGSPLKTDLSTLVENTNVTFVGGLILRHQQMLPSNVHSFTEVRGLQIEERGVAVMPFLSLTNHSCVPNVLRFSTTTHMILSILHPIKEGEQIFDNYGEHYALTPKLERQQFLLWQYYLKCECIACQENWPLYFDAKSYTSLVENPKDKYEISEALKKFRLYIDIAADGNVSDKPYMIPDLLKMIEVLYNLAPTYVKEMNSVEETLKLVNHLNWNRIYYPEL